MRRDYKNDTAKIMMTMASSNGTWLHGSQLPQRRFIDIRLNDKEHKCIANVHMTLDQFVSFIVSNSEVTCTLNRYRGVDGKIEREIVEPPETVNDKMTNRMANVHGDLLKRIADAEKDVYEMVNGGKKGAKQLRELLQDISVIKSHFDSNQHFVVQQAQEEVEDMQENMRAQIANAFAGLNLSVDNIKQLEGQKEDVLKLTSEKPIEPVEENYVMKKLW